MPNSERGYHLDRRAAKIADEVAGGGDQDQGLTDTEVSELLGVSPTTLQIWRTRGEGPPFVRLSPRIVRTRRCDLTAWLNERVHNSSANYGGGRKVGRRRGSKVINGRVVPPVQD